MTKDELVTVAKALGKAMAEKGYPGFTLDAWIPRVPDITKPTFEVLTHNGTIRFSFYD